MAGGRGAVEDRYLKNIRRKYEKYENMKNMKNIWKIYEKWQDIKRQRIFGIGRTRRENIPTREARMRKIMKSHKIEWQELCQIKSHTRPMRHEKMKGLRYQIYIHRHTERHIIKGKELGNIFQRQDRRNGSEDLSPDSPSPSNVHAHRHNHTTQINRIHTDTHTKIIRYSCSWSHFSHIWPSYITQNTENMEKWIENWKILRWPLTTYLEC